MERQLQGAKEAAQTTQTESEKQHCLDDDQTPVDEQRKEEEFESQEKIVPCTDYGSGVGGSTNSQKRKARQERSGHHGSRG